MKVDHESRLIIASGKSEFFLSCALTYLGSDVEPGTWDKLFARGCIFASKSGPTHDIVIFQ